MRTAWEVIFSVAVVALFSFITVLRWGSAFPRIGRWLDRKLGSNWFGPPPTDLRQPQSTATTMIGLAVHQPWQAAVPG